MTTKIQDKPNIHILLSAASILMLVTLFIFYGLKSTGTYYDDDIAHFLIARFSWKHPELFFNTWGRPVFTILYAPIALLGFSAVKIYSAIIAGLTCLGGIYLARLYHVRWYWLAAIFIGLQPEFLRQSFSSLTELSFAFVFCVALIAYKKQNWWVMAFAAGWLPLARYESLPIVLVFAIILILQKKYYLLLFIAAPLLIQNGFWAIKLKNVLYLLFPLNQIFGLTPSNVNFNYGTGDGFYYLRLLSVAFGTIVFLFLLFGSFREKFGILHLCILLTIGTLSITYWLVPGAGVAGYVRHLSIIAPAVGVLSVIGLEKFIESIKSSLPPLLQEHREIISSGLIFIIVVSTVVLTIPNVHPFTITRERTLVAKAANWFKNSVYKDRFALGAHTYFIYSAGLDEFDIKSFLPITPQNIDQSPKGSIIIWDSYYSPRLTWNTPLEILQDERRFRLIKIWQKAGFYLYFYEKLE